MMTIFIFTQKTCPPRNNLVAQYIRRAFCFIVCSNWLFYVNSIATHLAYLYGKEHVVFHLVKHRFPMRKWSYFFRDEGTFHTIIGFKVVTEMVTTLFKTRCRLLYDSAKRGVIFCGYMLVYQLFIVICKYVVNIDGVTFGYIPRLPFAYNVIYTQVTQYSVFS